MFSTTFCFILCGRVVLLEKAISTLPFNFELLELADLWANLLLLLLIFLGIDMAVDFEISSFALLLSNLLF